MRETPLGSVAETGRFPTLKQDDKNKSASTKSKLLLDLVISSEGNCAFQANELKEVVMKWQEIMRPSQIRRFALFLDEHPGFWPELVGEHALVCGFHVGGCFLTIDEMERLIGTQPQLEAQSVTRQG